MGGFLGWFVVIVGVLAIFNAEKLPELRALFETKFKSSMEVAKKGSKIARRRLKAVKTDIDNKKNMVKKDDDSDDNTPEEIEESLKFMGSYLNKEVAEEKAVETVEKAETKPQEPQVAEEDKPIDLENRY